MISKYIISQFNLEDINSIDEEKSIVFIKGVTSTLILKFINNTRECPCCKSQNIVNRGTTTNTLKTVLKGGEPAILKVVKRKFKCIDCNTNFQENDGKISDGHGISKYMKYEILYLLKNKKFSYLDVAIKYNVSPTYVQKIFDEYVEIKRHPLPEVLSIDEIYSRKLTETKYSCVLYDPINNEIIDILKSRKKSYLQDYFRKFTIVERDRVKYVTIDLNTTYRSIAYTYFKKAIICADSFHVIENLNRLFDSVRLRVMKEYESSKDRLSSDYWLFKKYNKFLLGDFSKINGETFYFNKLDMYINKYYAIDKMLNISSELREAYELKEKYRLFNQDYVGKDPSEKFNEIIKDFRSSSVPEMNTFGLLLSHWKTEILNSFKVIGPWRLSNANIERKNEDIKLLIANSHGFTNFNRTRNRILFSINKDEMILLEPKNKTNARYGKKRGKYKK